LEIMNNLDMLREFAAVAFTLALLAGALWWLRRRGLARWRRGGPERLMEIVESRALAPGHSLHLVRIADRVIALATHGTGCTVLEARPWTDLQKSMPQEIHS